MTNLNDSMQRFHDINKKYGAKNAEGKWGLSISKMYADGMTKANVVAVSVGTQEQYKTVVREDTSKLSGALSLADLNEHRAANGLETVLSQVDFDKIVKRTEGNFPDFETNATMNYRRNLYIWDMSEIISPKGSEAENSVVPRTLERTIQGRV